MFERITMIDYRRSLKDRAAARKHAGPYYWTPAPAKERSSGVGFYQSSKGLAMDPAGASLRLRLELASDLLPRHSRLRDTTGYFTDDFQDQTMDPIVARLPHGRGFLIGWTMGKGMAACLEADIYSDAESAAFAAYSFAENAAEQERAYQAKESARLEASECRGEIAKARAKLRALTREIKATGRAFSPAICQALRAQIRALRAESRAAHDRIEELAREYGAGILKEEESAA